MVHYKGWARQRHVPRPIEKSWSAFPQSLDFPAVKILLTNFAHTQASTKYFLELDRLRSTDVAKLLLCSTDWGHGPDDDNLVEALGSCAGDNR